MNTIQTTSDYEIFLAHVRNNYGDKLARQCNFIQICLAEKYGDIRTANRISSLVNAGKIASIENEARKLGFLEYN